MCPRFKYKKESAMSPLFLSLVVVNVSSVVPFPQGENAMTQDEEIEQIASQMDWNDHGDAQDESGDDEDPKIGRGAYVGGVWQDPLDPHPFPERERRSRSEFDPDYVLSPIRVKT